MDFRLICSWNVTLSLYSFVLESSSWLSVQLHVFCWPVFSGFTCVAQKVHCFLCVCQKVPSKCESCKNKMAVVGIHNILVWTYQHPRLIVKQVLTTYVNHSLHLFPHGIHYHDSMIERRPQALPFSVLSA